MAERRPPDTPFWVEPESAVSGRVKLSPEESHHLLHVHRARPGTPFQAVDGDGHLFECVLEEVERKSAVGRIVEERLDVGELRHRITLLVGLPDWSAIEQVVAHGVPLGVATFDFIPCERSERGGLGPQRVARLTRIAKAGVKQSRRTRLPVLRSSGSIEEALGAISGGRKLFADPEGNPAASFGARSAEDAISVAVGPPGGLTEGERRIFRDAGFSPISLGPSRLTTETAALALLGLVRNSL